jgi:hypothetical protein
MTKKPDNGEQVKPYSLIVAASVMSARALPFNVVELHKASGMLCVKVDVMKQFAGAVYNRDLPTEQKTFSEEKGRYVLFDNRKIPHWHLSMAHVRKWTEEGLCNFISDEMANSTTKKCWKAAIQKSFPEDPEKSPKNVATFIRTGIYLVYRQTEVGLCFDHECSSML